MGKVNTISDVFTILFFQFVLEMKIKNSILFHKVPSTYTVLKMYVSK